MAGFNSITLLGRLTRDPEIKTIGEDKKVANFSLAVDRPGKGDDKNCDFVPCQAWDKLAGIIGEYCTKGKQILIQGRLQMRKYTDNEGNNRTAAEVVVNTMQMLGSKAEGKGDAADLEAVSTDEDGFTLVSTNMSDIPF